MPLGLPFREIWCIDFEFIAGRGENPVPVCMVAKEVGTGRQVRLWQDQLGSEPPFEVNDDTLFVAYYAPAEVGCFLALGWSVPTRIIDLYAEFRRETNALAVPEGRGLLAVLSRHRLTGITSEEKKSGRDLVLRGGPWTDPNVGRSWTTARLTWFVYRRYWSQWCRAPLPHRKRWARHY